MKLKAKLIVALILIAVVDMVIPIPFTAILLLYVVIERPPWFKTWTLDIYNG